MKFIHLFIFAGVISCLFVKSHASLTKFEGILGQMGGGDVGLPGSSGSGSSGKEECLAKDALICRFQGTKYYKVGGYASYYPKWESGNCYVHFKAKVRGLEKNVEHKIHIHSYGDLSSNDGTSTGGHWYGPGPSDDKSDEEKLQWYSRGVLKTDSKGKVKTSYVDKHITLEGIVGRGMVIHGGQTPSQRVATCVIGYMNQE